MGWMSITWVLLGKCFLKCRGNAADGGGLFYFLRVVDVPPEWFAPLSLKQIVAEGLLAMDLRQVPIFLYLGFEFNSLQRTILSPIIFPTVVKMAIIDLMLEIPEPKLELYFYGLLSAASPSVDVPFRFTVRENLARGVQPKIPTTGSPCRIERQRLAHCWVRKSGSRNREGHRTPCRKPS